MSISLPLTSRPQAFRYAYVYPAVVVFDTPLPHDGMRVLVKCKLSTSSLGSYTATVLSPHHVQPQASTSTRLKVATHSDLSSGVLPPAL